jgi:hypothetical protein
VISFSSFSTTVVEDSVAGAIYHGEEAYVLVA